MPHRPPPKPKVEVIHVEVQLSPRLTDAVEKVAQALLLLADDRANARKLAELTERMISMREENETLKQRLEDAAQEQP